MNTLREEKMKIEAEKQYVEKEKKNLLEKCKKYDLEQDIFRHQLKTLTKHHVDSIEASKGAIVDVTSPARLSRKKIHPMTKKDKKRVMVNDEKMTKR